MSQVSVVIRDSGGRGHHEIFVDGKLVSECMNALVTAKQIAAVLDAMQVDNVVVLYTETGKRTTFLDR